MAVLKGSSLVLPNERKFTDGCIVGAVLLVLSVKSRAVGLKTGIKICGHWGVDGGSRQSRRA
jgi:hypothetical protein